MQCLTLKSWIEPSSPCSPSRFCCSREENVARFELVAEHLWSQHHRGYSWKCCLMSPFLPAGWNFEPAPPSLTLAMVTSCVAALLWTCGRWVGNSFRSRWNSVNSPGLFLVGLRRLELGSCVGKAAHSRVGAFNQSRISRPRLVTKF